MRLTEPAEGERHEHRHTSLRIRLLGAYHDGYVELYYPRVFRYELALGRAERGHGDWHYDEFRVTEDGRLLHEIEWSRGDPARWLIEASDVELSWLPGPLRDMTIV